MAGSCASPPNPRNKQITRRRYDDALWRYAPHMGDDTVLTVEDLFVTLDNVQVLRNISFTLRQSEAFAVIGPNGAGKTVLFRALLGLVPHTGVVRWRSGVEIGYVPQRFSVERSAPITALEFFLLQSPSFWRPTAVFIGQLEQELKLMGLRRDVLRKGLGELSGGETQRLLIAWALLRRPTVLLLDEPTAGVDAGFEQTIYALLHRIQQERGTALLLISHDLSVVYRYAQRVLCLNKSVVCQGSPVEALNPQALATLYGEAGLYHHEHGPGR
jgi:zinc transport system ATP-binding protein